MNTLNIALPYALQAFVQEQVKVGGYPNACEYITPLIRDDHDRKCRDEIDRQLLASLDSGPATPMTAEDWEGIRAEVRKRATKRAGKR
jgi:antitoxin ParD1/3/4